MDHPLKEEHCLKSAVFEIINR